MLFHFGVWKLHGIKFYIKCFAEICLYISIRDKILNIHNVINGRMHGGGKHIVSVCIIRIIGGSRSLQRSTCGKSLDIICYVFN